MMNTWYNATAYSMSYLMAEDTGAPELRNPLNSAMHADRTDKPESHPLRALMAHVLAIFAL